jgi:aspartyl-tRNA(Asn)/glutamyl-tRNA(Gln) amidotransferase subunit C
MARITISEVEHVAHLARLEFDQEEKERFAKELNDILEFVAQLEEVDTSGVEPAYHALELKNVFRQDRVEPSLPRQEALKNAPEAEEGAFVVPRII